MTHLGNPGWSYIAIFNLITFAKVLCQIRSYSQFPWIKMWTYLLGAHRLNPYRNSNVFEVLLCKCFNSENLNISFRLKSGSEFESKHNTETEQEAISGCARKWKSHELRSTFWMYTPLGYFFLHRSVGLGSPKWRQNYQCYGSEDSFPSPKSRESGRGTCGCFHHPVPECYRSVTWHREVSGRRNLLFPTHTIVSGVTSLWVLWPDVEIG